MCGGRLNPEHYDEFAEYLVMYVKTLKQKTGVDLYGISIQNEPYFANPFESNVVMPEEYADILKVVGSRFKAEGLPTKFFGPEHMAEWSWGWQQKYVNETLGDPEVKPFLDIYAVHGYVDGVAADYGSAEGWTSLYNNITVAHGKPLWMTETSDYDITGFPLAMSMSKSLYLALKFGKISAWVYWAMHDSVIKDNSLTPLGYAFKNYYRYVRPGAIVIDAISSDSDVLVLGFKHPVTNDVSIVLINISDETKDVDITIPFEHTELTLYRTSSTENCKDLGILPDYSMSVPGKSISTVTTIKGSGVTGAEKKKNIEVAVYPNPIADRLTLEFSAPGHQCSVQISDLSGKTMTTLSSIMEKKTEIDTRGWGRGLYLVRVTQGEKSSISKILVR
jgi:O-glycosyl hydrolase